MVIGINSIGGGLSQWCNISSQLQNLKQVLQESEPIAADRGLTFSPGGLVPVIARFCMRFQGGCSSRPMTGDDAMSVMMPLSMRFSSHLYIRQAVGCIGGQARLVQSRMG
jgi:hypothetical protein